MHDAYVVIRRKAKAKLNRSGTLLSRPPLITVGLLAVVLVVAAFGFIMHPGSHAADAAAWNVLCGIDHYGRDDPIVFPGTPGASHMHSFYGNTTTNANSTPASLQAGPSSCSNGLAAVDRSAYWVPSLYYTNAQGSSVQYTDDRQNVVVYYRRAGGTTGPKVQPFPLGFRMIAGDPNATSPQSTSIVQWDCGEGGPDLPAPPTCAGGASQQLHASLIFPNCWDGVHLDSANHKSHMAYADTNGNCPADHPVTLPEITFEVDYPYLAGGPNYYLSSGGIYSWHGDFIAAWDSRAQNALVTSCLNTPQNCTGVYLFGDTFEQPSPSQMTPINLNDFQASPPFTGAQTSSSSGSVSTPKPAARAGTAAAPTPVPAPATTTTPSATPAAAEGKPSPSPKAVPSGTRHAGWPILAGGIIGLLLTAYLVFKFGPRLMRRER